MEYYFAINNQKMYYKWSNCKEGFNMPLTIKMQGKNLSIYPNKAWKSIQITRRQAAIFNPETLVKKYYITVKISTKPVMKLVEQ